MLKTPKKSNFEISRSDTHFQARMFLNDVGFDNGAYVIGEQLTAEIFFNPITLKIADCNKHILLNFSKDPKEITNSCSKLKRLKESIELIENLLKEEIKLT